VSKIPRHETRQGKGKSVRTGLIVSRKTGGEVVRNGEVGQVVKLSGMVNLGGVVKLDRVVKLIMKCFHRILFDFDCLLANTGL
jgi:hypothetical protein